MSMNLSGHLPLTRGGVAQRRQLLDVVAAAQLDDRGGIWLASSLAQQGGELVEVVLMAGWRRLKKGPERVRTWGWRTRAGSREG